MSVHAFVDESIRDNRYILTAALVDPGDLRRLRALMGCLLLPGQRELHFQKEKPQRRRQLIGQVVASGAKASVYLAICNSRGQEGARAACLQRLVHDLIAVRAHRLVLDSRVERDRYDIRTLQVALGAHPSDTHLSYEHMDSTQDRIIWVADMIGWAYGAGGEWRQRIATTITAVTNCTLA